MKALTVIFIICCIIVIGLYSYNYFTMPKLDKLNTTDNCIAQYELNDFGLLNENNYSLFIPKEWQFAKLDSTLPTNTIIFSTNPNNEYEFCSIWSGDYNKTAKDLLLDSIKPLTNYTIEDQKPIINEKGIEFKHMLINFKNEEKEFNQDLYTYVNNNKAYMILIRNNTENQTSFEKTLKKIICSFKTNSN